MKIKVELDRMGMGLVTLNGEPLHGVVGVKIDDKVGKVPEVLIEMIAMEGFTFEGDALVRLRVGSKEYELREIGGAQ